jgi:hypothetical protein
MTTERDLFSQTPAVSDSSDTAGSGSRNLVMRSTTSLSVHPALTRLGLQPKQAYVLKLQSIGQSVFDQPLLITKKGIIIEGHARQQAAKELGLEKVPCIEVDLPLMTRSQGL